MTEPMRWKMFAYLAALFVAGVITGAAVMSRTAANGQTLKVGRTDEISNMIRQKLIITLELTPEQETNFAPLIKKTSEELEASHLDCLKRVSTALDKMHEESRPALTADQLEKLRHVEDERRAMMRQKYNYPPETAKAGTP